MVRDLGVWPKEGREGKVRGRSDAENPLAVIRFPYSGDRENPCNSHLMRDRVRGGGGNIVFIPSCWFRIRVQSERTFGSRHFYCKLETN